MSLIDPLRLGTAPAPHFASKSRTGYLLRRHRCQSLGLDILAEWDAVLLNIYHVIEVNPAKWPKVNSAGAKAFADFMVSRQTQDFIRKFGVEKYASPLFFPDAGKKEEALGK